MIRSIKIITLITFIVLNQNLFSQEEADKLNFNASYIGDFVNNLSGGIKTGSVFLGKIDLMLAFSTDNVGLWKNGEFYINIQNTHGGTPSGSYVGDIQVLSNIENGDYTYLYQIWFRQYFGKFSFLLGVHDLNAEFDLNDYCGVFLNSSFGIMPDISLNVPAPIFPKNALGFLLRYDFSNNIIFQTAIYDGNPGSLDSDPYNMDLSLSKEQGFLSINELTVNYYDDDHKKGTYTLGGYYHSAKSYKISDSTVIHNGNYGLYYIGSHCLYSENDLHDQGLNLFLQLGWAPKERNFSELYAGIGLNYTGLFPKRENDILGIAFGYLSLSNEYINSVNSDWLKSESVIELTYKLQINEIISIQPDIQYIINPGANKNYDNAFVGILRTSILF